MKRSNIYFICILFLLFACNESIENKSETQDQAKTEPIKNNRVPMYSSISGGNIWGESSTGLSDDLLVSFIDAFENKLIIGTEKNGLFISDESRKKWQPLVKQFQQKKINALHIWGEEIFIAIYREGIHKSTDGGKTWTSLNGNLEDLRVQAIIKLENAILIATDTGILKSTTDGEWESVFKGHQVVSMNMYEEKIIAGSTGGVLLSENNGDDWDWIHEMGAIHNTAILDGAIVAMYISNDLFVSEDWGESWTLADYSPKVGSYVYEAAEIYDHFIMSNNYGIHRSDDRGKTWNLIYPTKDVFFFDFFVWDSIVYGGTR